MLERSSWCCCRNSRYGPVSRAGARSHASMASTLCAILAEVFCTLPAVRSSRKLGVTLEFRHFETSTFRLESSCVHNHCRVGTRQVFRRWTSVAPCALGVIICSAHWATMLQRNLLLLPGWDSLSHENQVGAFPLPRFSFPSPADRRITFSVMVGQLYHPQ